MNRGHQRVNVANEPRERSGAWGPRERACKGVRGTKSPGENMTTKTRFLESGHLPTLVGALIYFDVSFMVWVLLGPLAPFLREQYHLTATQQGLMVAVPLLGGSLFRPLLGMAGDRIGGCRTGLIGLALTLVPLFVGWKVAQTIGHLYVVGLLLGVAGASFAVALPLASRWYPPEHQGLAMGIAGAGNSGSLLATLAAPRLAQRFGWEATFGLMLVPVVIVMILFATLARDSPNRTRQRWHDYGAVLRERDTVWFSCLYGLTFGGFVGFTSFLTTFFNDQYHVSKVSAGDFTTIVIVAGSLLRPVGGWLSDRIGGYRLLLLLLAAVAGVLAAASTLPPLPVVIALLFVATGCLGMGNGAVFQLVPQRFANRMGLVTGIVGAAGGLGGFFLPSMLGAVKDLTGTYAPGLLLLAFAFLAGAAGLLQLGSVWAAQWQTAAVRQSGIFCYRRVVRGWRGQQAA
jgi:MFS transporter, NNP family, nitrate/nitrite transporter